MPAPNAPQNTRIELLIEAFESHVLSLIEAATAHGVAAGRLMDKANSTRKGLATALRSFFAPEVLTHPSRLTDFERGWPRQYRAPFGSPSGPLPTTAHRSDDIRPGERPLTGSPFQRPLLRPDDKAFEPPVLTRTCATCFYETRGYGAPLVTINGKDAVCIRVDCPGRPKR
jgi:hypothetical protein